MRRGFFNNDILNLMDIFSHGLWAAAGAKGLNKAQDKRRVNIWVATLWGMFPDLFAFSIPFMFIVGSVIFGSAHFSDFGAHPMVAEPPGGGAFLVAHLAHALYNVSHSLVVFSVVFFGVWAYFKQARLELLGWFLHIIMDIPTHTYAFFPTPVFWPLFDWRFNGFSWANPRFLILNYSVLLIVYAVLWRKQRLLRT